MKKEKEKYQPKPKIVDFCELVKAITGLIIGLIFAAVFIDSIFIRLGLLESKILGIIFLICLVLFILSSWGEKFFDKRNDYSKVQDFLNNK